MMHSRGFVLSENQAFAGQTRTPGPSRLHASPTRKNMTTGKRALGQSSKLFGQDAGPSGPKQLFKDTAPSTSPVKALGDRNASKTPGPSRTGPSKQDGSLRKGGKEDSSPTKKGSSGLSPRKASTSNALRSLNGKQRQTTDLPFAKPGQSSGNGQDASANTMKTPAPSQLGKARTMSRQNSFVTPAANTGRAGQIKARMGEIMDAEMGLSLQKGDNATEQAVEPPAVQMSEEEMYPEIEYMPPSMHAKHPVFEFPDELDDLPRAKELGARLSRFSSMALRAAGADDLSDVELSPMKFGTDDDLAPPTSAGDSDDDDPWPDVVVTDSSGVEQQAHPTSRPNVAVSRASSNVAPRTTVPSRSVPVGAGRAAAATATGARAGAAYRANGTASMKPSTGALAASTRAVPVRATNQPVARSTGLQRSIASAPGSRATAASRTVTASKPALAAAAAAAAARGVARPLTATNRPVAPQGHGTSALHSMPPKHAATRLNPKLIDFVDDDLGKQTAATLDRLDADEGLESLQLDLGDAPEHEV